MINEILLANLEKFRNWKGWTWEQLYEYLEVGRSTMHTWKAGKCTPNALTLESIARKLDIFPYELLNPNYTPGKNHASAHNDTMNEKLKYFQHEFNRLNTEFAAFVD